LGLSPGPPPPDTQADWLDPTCGAPEGGQPLAADLVPQGLGLQNLDALAVSQDPPPEFRTHGDPEAHLQLAGQERRQSLARVPRALGDIAGDMAGEAKGNSNRIPPEQAKAAFEVTVKVEFGVGLEGVIGDAEMPEAFQSKGDHFAPGMAIGSQVDSTMLVPEG
jgi:hypothetical protein